MISPMHSSDLRPQDSLIDWFGQHRADLPWRRERNPYAVWVSEIMLQQTQVTTVIPYYERWMTRFPSVEALASASQAEVLKAWEGLGYYSRARNLHRAAQMIVTELGGQFPETVEGLRELPGVGPYTAGAIANFAFGLDAPLVDGNVIRVLTRLDNLDADIGTSAVQKALWARAESLLPPGRAPLWNEGLMELGRLICTPIAPHCDRCPLAEHCESRRLGTQLQRPVKAAKARTPHYDVAAGVIYGADGRILIAQRKPEGLLGGLWEFPGGKREDGEALPEALRRELMEELGIEVEIGRQVATVKHAFTHFRITLHAFECRHSGGEPQALDCADFAWVLPEQFESYAFGLADRKVIAALRGAGGQLSLPI